VRIGIALVGANPWRRGPCRRLQSRLPEAPRSPGNPLGAPPKTSPTHPSDGSLGRPASLAPQRSLQGSPPIPLPPAGSPETPPRFLRLAFQPPFEPPTRLRPPLQGPCTRSPRRRLHSRPPGDLPPKPLHPSQPRGHPTSGSSATPGGSERAPTESETAREGSENDSVSLPRRHPRRLEPLRQPLQRCSGHLDPLQHPIQDPKRRPVPASDFRAPLSRLLGPPAAVSAATLPGALKAIIARKGPQETTPAPAQRPEHHESTENFP
jgi:hypothetical protein